MEKEELLRELQAKIASGELTKSELATLLSLEPSHVAEAEKKASHFTMTKMLYVIGSVIAVLGIVFFVAQIWEDIGPLSRIVVTLGLGMLLAGIGSYLLEKEGDRPIGQIFHFLGGMLIPGGALVVIEELGVDTDTLWPFILAFGVIFLGYMTLAMTHKKPILTFFAIANGTTFLYCLIGELADGAGHKIQESIYAYLTMVVGLSYLLLAHHFQVGWNSKLVKVLHFFGSLAFLGAAFSRVFESDLWELFYFFVALGLIYVSIYLKSQIILVVSTIFLIAYITYITSEHFADSLGWPISLVLLGFVFIGLGYASVNISKKYIKESGTIA